MKRTLSFGLTLIFVFSVLIVAMPVIAHAASTVTYYVDSIGGSNSNSGTSESAPLLSADPITKALGAGDQVLFRCGGTYTCGYTLTAWCGTKTSPVVISSYGTGNKPILTTSAATEVLRLFDCSFIAVSNLEFTAPNGGGIWIDTLNTTSTGITITDCDFHNMQNHTMTSRDNLSAGAAAARACIMVKGLPARSRYAVNDLTIMGCNMYDCGNGISVWGSWNDSQTPWCENEADIHPVYNTGLLIRDCSFQDMDAEATVIGMCDGALITNCRSINCCQGVGADENGKTIYYNAAMWFWGSENSTFDHCEIAGQKNQGDGMAVDFDSHSNNCTYQYIYSHDNTSFMCNNPNYSGQHGNTVRYCLSVNDNHGSARSAVGHCGEHGFKFYNNTIVGCANLFMRNIFDSFIANNIFVPKENCRVSFDFLTAEKYGNTVKNNCYYNAPNPVGDLSSLNTLPGFTGTDLTDKKSFALSASSPLIGAGADVGTEDVNTDFFGNALSRRSIGCYCGSGTDAAYTKESPEEMAKRLVTLLVKLLINEIKTGIMDKINH